MRATQGVEANAPGTKKLPTDGRTSERAAAVTSMLSGGYKPTPRDRPVPASLLCVQTYTSDRVHLTCSVKRHVVNLDSTYQVLRLRNAHFRVVCEFDGVDRNPSDAQL